MRFLSFFHRKDRNIVGKQKGNRQEIDTFLTSGEQNVLDDLVTKMPLAVAFTVEDAFYSIGAGNLW